MTVAEIRSTKFETNSNHQKRQGLKQAQLQLIFCFGIWSLGFVSDFGFRASNLICDRFTFNFIVNRLILKLKTIF